MKNNQNMATVWLRTLKRSYIKADDWEAVSRSIAANELEVNFIAAKITITPEGEEERVIEDRFEPQIQNLCLHASRELLADRDYDCKIWNYQGMISLKNEGEFVRMHGDHIQSISLPKRELIASLLDCAAQGMDLILKLETNYPEYRFSIKPYLEGLFMECKKMYDAKYKTNDRHKT